MGLPSAIVSILSLPRLAAGMTILASAFFTGCSTTALPPGSQFVVSAPFAEFYKNGPAQELSFTNPQTSALRTVSGEDHGPDAQLPKGANVTLLKREIGFSRIVTDSGVVGYVSNDQLRPAPVITRAATISSPAWKQNPAPRRSRSPQTRPPVDQLDLSDIPLPLPS